MIIHRTQYRRQRGDSLIEVMIALSLIAITTLGLIAGQTWFARSERMVLARERATLIADSVAEGTRARRRCCRRATSMCSTRRTACASRS
jgi:prepilin-type N-terminal cleavage/methylation domain-containing protein